MVAKSSTKAAKKPLKVVKPLFCTRRVRGGAPFEPTAVLKSTEKAANAALLIQERCNACHGQTVRDVLGSMVNGGKRYTVADLKYDVKTGRLAVLPPGTSAGEIPQGKVRADAPCAGQLMPEASLDEFFLFLQGQLRFETNELAGKDLTVKDKRVEAMWPDVQAFVTPNLGATERWVPYHTILGVHELFLVESVHSRTAWSEKQRFIAMFVFRAHCKRDLFTQAQLPLMLKSSFWQDPAKAFEPGGPMEKSILKYRKETGAPLLTSCFRIIPERLLKDDTENLVRSITNRSQRLLQVAEEAFPIVKDTKMSARDKVTKLSNMIQEAQGLGETWAKMLTVCIDLAYPKEKLLESVCDVGTGAAKPLRRLLGNASPDDNRKALTVLQKLVNSCKTPAAKTFWDMLEQAENVVRSRYKAFPLVCQQAKTRKHCMTAVTLQVQLCEYRQFRHSLARNKYGLPDDETMRVDPDVSTRLHPEDFIELDQKRDCIAFKFPTTEKKTIPVDVPLKAVGGSKPVAVRVASMCFQKLVSGLTAKEVKAFRDDLLRGFMRGEDAPPTSEAWAACQTALSHSHPLVSFAVQTKGGSMVRIQTTRDAAGSILEAERIARLCYLKLAAGMQRDKVLDYRNTLYSKRKASSALEPSQKRQRSAGA